MAIEEFRGEYRWLSNFYYHPVLLDGVVYPSTEHAYQAAKFDDPKTRERIRNAPTFKQAKYLGYGTGLRSNWNSIRLQVMEDLLRQKFAPDTELASKLMLTAGDKLVEGNNWNDIYWGICNGHGENHLGKLLMKIREELIRTINDRSN